MPPQEIIKARQRFKGLFDKQMNSNIKQGLINTPFNNNENSQLVNQQIISWNYQVLAEAQKDLR